MKSSLYRAKKFLTKVKLSRKRTFCDFKALIIVDHSLDMTYYLKVAKCTIRDDTAPIQVNKYSICSLLSGVFALVTKILNLCACANKKNL